MIDKLCYSMSKVLYISNDLWSLGDRKVDRKFFMSGSTYVKILRVQLTISVFSTVLVSQVEREIFTRNFLWKSQYIPRVPI